MVTVSELKTLEALQILDQQINRSDEPHLEAVYLTSKGRRRCMVSLIRGDERPAWVIADTLPAALVALAELLQETD